MKDKIEPVLDEASQLKAVETALTMPQAKSFAPPKDRGLHELLEELKATLELAEAQLTHIRNRNTELDRLLNIFYNGRKP